MWIAVCMTIATTPSKSCTHACLKEALSTTKLVRVACGPRKRYIIMNHSMRSKDSEISAAGIVIKVAKEPVWRNTWSTVHCNLFRNTVVSGMLITMDKQSTGRTRPCPILVTLGLLVLVPTWMCGWHWSLMVNFSCELPERIYYGRSRLLLSTPGFGTPRPLMYVVYCQFEYLV